MTAGTGTETVATTFSRVDMLIRQLNLMVKGTTGSSSFEAAIRKGIQNQWIERVSICGITKDGLRKQQIDISIDWKIHELKLSEIGEQSIRVNIAEREANWISKAIGGIIDGFNEIKESEKLSAQWVVYYTAEANSRRAQVDLELGLVDTTLPAWENGNIEAMVEAFRPKKLQEAEFSWRVVTSK